MSGSSTGGGFGGSSLFGGGSSLFGSGNPLMMLNQMSSGGQQPYGLSSAPFGFMPGFSFGYPSPVPSALGQPGTQASTFGTMTGLGNPMLLPLLLMMSNYATSVNPFNPVVQAGSPAEQHGVYSWFNGLPYYPMVGSELPANVTPGFQTPAPLSAPPTQIPGNLEPRGHGPFRPGQRIGHGVGTAGTGDASKAWIPNYYAIYGDPLAGGAMQQPALAGQTAAVSHSGTIRPAEVVTRGTVETARKAERKPTYERTEEEQQAIIEMQAARRRAEIAAGNVG